MKSLARCGVLEPEETGRPTKKQWPKKTCMLPQDHDGEVHACIGKKEKGYFDWGVRFRCREKKGHSVGSGGMHRFPFWSTRYDYLDGEIVVGSGRTQTLVIGWMELRDRGEVYRDNQYCFMPEEYEDGGLCGVRCSREWQRVMFHKWDS